MTATAIEHALRAIVDARLHTEIPLCQTLCADGQAHHNK